MDTGNLRRFQQLRIKPIISMLKPLAVDISVGKPYGHWKPASVLTVEN